jgi:dephospho-CoA kinase
MYIAGLTGNYGMGKSFVLSVFKELGAEVLGSDEIVHHLLQDKKVISKVKKILGGEALNEHGMLIKKNVARIIFNNSELREKLEAILHPLVFHWIQKYLQKIKGNQRLVIVEVPLLFEGAYQGRFRRTITVYTTQKTALERLKKCGISRRNAMQRLKVQLPVQIKKKKADYLIDNNGSKQETRKQVENIYEQLREEMLTKG